MFDCFQDVSDRVDKEDSDSFLVHALETNKSDVIDDVAANGQQQVKQGWHERLDSVSDINLNLGTISSYFEAFVPSTSSSIVL